MSAGIAETANVDGYMRTAAARTHAGALRAACVAGCVCALHAGVVAMLAARPFERSEPVPVRVVSAELLPAVSATRTAVSTPPAVRRPERVPPSPPAPHAARRPAIPERPARAVRNELIAAPPARPVASAAPGMPTPSVPATQAGPAPASSAPAPPSPTIATPAVPKSVARLDCAIVEPGYPALSRRRGEAGTAVIELQIDVTGRVASARVATTSGYPRLDDAARDAVLTSRCAPYVENGTARPARANVPVTFNLSDQQEP